MRIELHGLEVFGHHGVLESEKRDGQTFLFDVELEVDEPATDSVEDAVDYREIAGVVDEVSGATRCDLLESLAVLVADALLAAFPVRSARVCVRKRRPGGLAAEWSAATVERSR